MNTLTREQVEAVGKRLGPTIGYLVRLRERMGKVGFVPGDRLYDLAMKAEHVMRELGMELHDLSCAGGVGRAPETP
jgi:hypothetical protein